MLHALQGITIGDQKDEKKINQSIGLNGKTNASTIYHILDIILNIFASDADYLFCNHGGLCLNINSKWVRGAQPVKLFKETWEQTKRLFTYTPCQSHCYVTLVAMSKNRCCTASILCCHAFIFLLLELNWEVLLVKNCSKPEQHNITSLQHRIAFIFSICVTLGSSHKVESFCAYKSYHWAPAIQHTFHGSLSVKAECLNAWIWKKKSISGFVSVAVIFLYPPSLFLLFWGCLNLFSTCAFSISYFLFKNETIWTLKTFYKVNSAAWLWFYGKFHVILWITILRLGVPVWYHR